MVGYEREAGRHYLKERLPTTGGGWFRLNQCFPKSTDINEAVVVLSGVEYPERFLTLDQSNSRVVLDLGSNIGAFALLFHRLNTGLNYQGYAFEPHPGNAALLEENLRTNNVTCFNVVRKAAAGVNARLKFDVSASFDAFKIDSYSENYIEVDGVRLSDFCAANDIDKIDLLKIDIEGGEYEILDRDLDFLERSVEVILMEYHQLDGARNCDYLLRRLSRSFDAKVEHGHASGGIVSAVRKRSGKR